MNDTRDNNQRRGEQAKGDARVASSPLPVVRRRLRSFRGTDSGEKPYRALGGRAGIHGPHNPFDIRAVARLRRRWSEAGTNKPVRPQKFFAVLPTQWEDIITSALEEKAVRATKKAAAHAQAETPSVLPPSSAVSASAVPPILAAGGNATPTAHAYGFTGHTESQIQVLESAFPHDPAASSAFQFPAPHPASPPAPQDPFARNVASNPWAGPSTPAPVSDVQHNPWAASSVPQHNPWARVPTPQPPPAPRSAFAFAPSNAEPADIENPFTCFLPQVSSNHAGPSPDFAHSSDPFARYAQHNPWPASTVPAPETSQYQQQVDSQPGAGMGEAFSGPYAAEQHSYAVAQDQQDPHYTSSQHYPTQDASQNPAPPYPTSPSSYPAPPYPHTAPAPSPAAPTPEALAHLAAQCACPAEYARVALYASAVAWAVDWRAVAEGVRVREEAQQQYAQTEPREEEAPAFSLLYGPGGCPPRRVRPIEVEVEVVGVDVDVDEDEGQAEWWAAQMKAGERERGAKKAHVGVEGKGDEGDEGIAVRHTPKARTRTDARTQAYMAVREAKQRDLESYALVGHAKRAQFRNGYMALGMQYRPAKRARAAEAWADGELRRRGATFAAGESGSDEDTGGDGSEDEEEESDGEGSEYSSSSSSASSTAHSPSRRTSPSRRAYPSPYARPTVSSSHPPSSSAPRARKGRAARSCGGLVDSVVGFFGRIGVEM